MRTKPINVNCFSCESRLHSVFCQISDDDVLAVNLNKTRYTYQKGDILFHKDTVPLGAFIIETGKLKISTHAGKGREQIVRLTRAGDIIGYRALLNETAYSSTAEALEETNVCFLNKDLFQELMRKNTSVSKHIMKLMANELNHTEKLLSGSNFRPVKSKVAEMILHIREKYGFESDNCTINISLTRSDLSALSGTATETLIRTLIALKEEQLIDFSGKRIKVLDQRRLTSLAVIK